MDQQEKALIKSLHRDLWIFSLVMILSAAVSIFFQNMVWMTVSAFSGSIFWIGNYFIRNKNISFPHGPANGITMLRLGLILATGWVHTGLSSVLLGILFVIICIGDYFDGRLARSLHITSTIGEYLDKETDALFVLFASMILYLHDLSGALVMVLGLIRYIYFLIMYFFIQENQKERKDPAARVIAVVVFVSLLAAFFIPTTLSEPILIGSIILLIYSFSRSVFIETGVIQ